MRVWIKDGTVNCNRQDSSGTKRIKKFGNLNKQKAFDVYDESVFYF